MGGGSAGCGGWSDGTSEDVTPLCRFQSNDEQVATVTQDGFVGAGSTGDTHVVVFYDSAVVPIPVLRPVNDRNGPSYPMSLLRRRLMNW